MKKILIGLHGKPRSGKDTLAAHLIAKYSLLRYGPSVRVKDTTAAMFAIPRWFLDDDKMKEEYDPFWKMTYREMAQKVGKECSRDVFGDDIWMKHCELKWRGIKSPRHFLNIDPNEPSGVHGGMILADIRYASEIEWVKRNGGLVVFIVRDNLPVSSGAGHPAEAGLPLDLADRVLYNNGTIEDLYQLADSIFEVPEGSCCYNEWRNSNGGCDNCGDPCY